VEEGRRKIAREMEGGAEEKAVDSEWLLVREEHSGTGTAAFLR